MKTTLRSRVFAGALFLSLPTAAFAQLPITEVFTDYHGLWTSTTAANSTDKPDTSHTLLAFTYNGTTYSTGVNDVLLSANTVNFQPGNYQAFNLVTNGITPVASTVLGVGNLYGGSGNVTPVPVNGNLSQYLHDGVNGLDLGTAIFNLPPNNVNYTVNNFNLTSIGDTIPDIVVTQVGQPPASTSLDTFRFETASGAVVGNPLAVSLSGISVVGTGYWKFYDPGNPPTYNAQLLGDRPLRMLAFELSDFGINSSNVGTISRFVHKLSGQSDQAFIAYNTSSFTATTGVPLPVKLVSFSVSNRNGQALLHWETAEAKNFSHFELERSIDAVAFARIGTVSSGDAIHATYSFTDAEPAAGINYYRLKMVDQNGSYTYSAIAQISFMDDAAVTVYPNPARHTLTVSNAQGVEEIALYNMNGNKMPVTFSQKGNHATVDISKLPQGIYTLELMSSGNAIKRKVTIL